MEQTNEMVKNLLKELGQILQTESVVGQPIQAGESTVIPVSKLSFGFGGGGGKSPAEKKETGEGSAIGGGASIEPVAFIVITEGKSQMLSVAGKGGLSVGKVIDLIPEIMEQVKGFKGKRGEKKEEGKKEKESEK